LGHAGAGDALRWCADRGQSRTGSPRHHVPGFHDSHVHADGPRSVSSCSPGQPSPATSRATGADPHRHSRPPPATHPTGPRDDGSRDVSGVARGRRTPAPDVLQPRACRSGSSQPEP
jgi:hypothetical protein